MELSWFKVIGYPIKGNVPTPILMLVTESHGYILENDSVTRSKVVITLNNNYKNISTVDTPPPANQLGLVARFINPRAKNWRKGVLLRHFHHIIDMVNDRVSPDWDEVCLPDPYNHNTTHPIFCYRECERIGIYLDPDTTISHMVRLIKYNKLSQKGLSALSHSVVMKVDVENDRGLLLTLAQRSLSCSRVNEKKLYNFDSINIQDVITSSNNTGNRDHILHLAKSDSVAIIIAIRNYGVDVSKCLHPIAALVTLANDSTTEDCKVLLEGSVSAKEEFNMAVPHSVYKIEHLREYYRSINKGVEPTTLTRAALVDLLFLSSSNNSFYHGYIGRNVDLEADICVDMQPPTFFPNDDIVCYGNAFDQMIPITYETLANAFNETLCFYKPFTQRDIFTDEEVHRLDVIATNHNKPFLSAAIQRIKNLKNEAFGPAKVIKEAVRRLGNVEKYEINGIMEKILDMALAMRGWNGDPAERLSKIRITSHNLDEITIQRNVGMAIEDFRKANRQAKDKYNIDLGSLILMSVSRDGSLVPYMFQGSRITLSRKLEILQDPVMFSDVMATCIRLASNDILATYYSAKFVITGEAPFELVNGNFEAS